jgi:glycosyltransferase involved in cell wall biosynthesis
MKRVLIISYYWPPSGGIGVLRNLKFVKYLHFFGWEPIVYIPKNAQYPYLDNNNFNDVPKDLTIISQPIIEPYSLFKLVTGKSKNIPLNNPVAVRNDKLKATDKLGIWLRGNFFIPDARMLWIKPSVKFLLRFLKDYKIDAIFTDGPPHTNTRIGSLLKSKTGIPWLADFQDPWTQVDYLQRFKLTKWAWKRHEAMEQFTFKMADKITSASPRSAKQLQDIGANDVSCIYYGYDEDDFKNAKQNKNVKFNITHAGLLGIDRKPDGLFEALQFLKKKYPSFNSTLEITLVGQVDYEVLQTFKSFGLQKNLNQLGTISRKNVIDIILNSWVLLLCINKAENADGRIPAKIFEYIRTGNPILALGPSDSDIF